MSLSIVNIRFRQLLICPQKKWRENSRNAFVDLRTCLLSTYCGSITCNIASRNNDENGCVLDAKFAMGAQYNWCPTMLMILGILSLYYIFQHRYFFDISFQNSVWKCVLKILQKVKIFSILSKLFQYSSSMRCQVIFKLSHFARERQYSSVVII